MRRLSFNVLEPPPHWIAETLPPERPDQELKASSETCAGNHGAAA